MKEEQKNTSRPRRDSTLLTKRRSGKERKTQRRFVHPSHRRKREMSEGRFRSTRRIRRRRSEEGRRTKNTLPLTIRSKSMKQKPESIERLITKRNHKQNKSMTNP
ncbi:hypothetical protein BLNAU_5704 [Blattamonas nauphoetae]|uniref:Uncharacterized protein n=1 Tax=Blattamonas nauphoetae TaxID=2049346 RepID=A0ABQ9Y6K4_9EUKA|nr:hypothetical protein BLNAU_5704 [Blattamonas nauphoetae]